MIGGTRRWGDYWSSSVLYYHTHAPHTTTSLNNASHRRDSAAAVATRERCGRVETAGGGLREDWSEPDRVLMSFLSLSLWSVHSSPHIHRPPAVIHQYSIWAMHTSVLANKSHPFFLHLYDPSLHHLHHFLFKAAGLFFVLLLATVNDISVSSRSAIFKPHSCPTICRGGVKWEC